MSRSWQGAVSGARGPPDCGGIIDIIFCFNNMFSVDSFLDVNCGLAYKTLHEGDIPDKKRVSVPFLGLFGFSRHQVSAGI